MNIIGPDELLFGVYDVAACTRYLTDYGLQPVEVTSRGGRFEARDGTAIRILGKDDSDLPPRMETATMLRKTVYGVADQATLDNIAHEISKDREIRYLSGGSIESIDDMGFTIGFQVTVRRRLDMAAEGINAPGAPPGRALNVVGVDDGAVIHLRTLSHVVYFVPDVKKAEAFYIERLGFRCTDRFIPAGPFLRPQGSLDHHCLFLIETPAHMKGCEHFTFHVGGPTEMLQAGARFVAKGYQSFWGPGRHKMGSNWFWYFNSPLGCHVEYDADMDLHDDQWSARTVPINADNSQLFLFALRDKWSPGGPPQPDGPH